MFSWLQIPEALISPSKSGEGPPIAERPIQDLLENPPQTDHLEKGQGTELPIPTKNIAVSIQNEIPDDYPASNFDSLFVHSVKTNQPLCPNQDNPQSDTAVQAPSDKDIPLPAIFPSIQYIMKDDSEESKDLRENDEMDMAQPQDPSTYTKQADSTESSLQELHESTQQCSLNELITASAIKGEGDVSHSTNDNILFKESREPLRESPEMQLIKHGNIVRQETCRKQQAGLWVGEVPDTIASCMLQPLEPTDLGHARNSSVIQIVSSTRRTPDSEVIECQKQGQGPKPELKEVLEVLPVNVDTPSSLESTAHKDESPTLISLSSATATSQSLTTTVQAVAPEGGDAEPSMTLEEPLSDKNSELYFDDPTSFQKQEELKSQPPLPCKTLKASNSEADVILGKTLIPSFAFLSATVCLVVGFHEPSIFLIMTLFLVSLCF